MVAKTKRTPYTEISGTLDAEAAYIQASHALDVAAFIAEENRDVEGLLTVAQTYVAIAERLTPGYHEAEEESDEEKEPFGFCTTAISDDEHEPFTQEELEQEYDDEEDEDAVSDSLRVKLESESW